MNVEDLLFKKITDLNIPHFFITVEIGGVLNQMPTDIEFFILEKHKKILAGATGRKFIYQTKDYKLIFTFFPTDRVVDERYALKNKVQFRRLK